MKNVFSLLLILLGLHTVYCQSNLSKDQSDYLSANVLLTGFDAFLNFDTNPTTKIAQALDQKCFPFTRTLTDSTTGFSMQTPQQYCFTSWILPVNRTGALYTTQVLSDYLKHNEEIPYDAILHTGLEDVAKGLKFEVAATNNKANDTGGPSTEPAIPGAAELFPTTANLGWFELQLPPVVQQYIRTRSDTSKYSINTMHNVSTELWSRNAGDYYCNEVYYRTVHFLRTQHVKSHFSSTLLPAMFVHVPNMTESSIQQDVEIIKAVTEQLLLSSWTVPQRAPPKFTQAAGLIQIQKGTFAGLIVLSAVGPLILFILFRLWWSRRKQPTDDHKRPLL